VRGSAGETRERLVAAAAAVFNRDGYFATDSNKLARAAGYSPGTFYKSFADKRAAFLAAYERWVEDEWADVGAELARAPSGRGRSAAITRVVLGHHRRWAGFRASLRALVATDELVRGFVWQKRKQQLTTLAELRKRLGWPRRSRAEDWALLLLLERVCDSLASGEARALGAGEDALLAVLERALDDHVRK
jgi:AcrR family transcriptional regulator